MLRLASFLNDLFDSIEIKVRAWDKRSRLLANHLAPCINCGAPCHGTRLEGFRHINEEVLCLIPGMDQSLKAYPETLRRIERILK